MKIVYGWVKNVTWILTIEAFEPLFFKCQLCMFVTVQKLLSKFRKNHVGGVWEKGET